MYTHARRREKTRSISIQVVKLASWASFRGCAAGLARGGGWEASQGAGAAPQPHLAGVCAGIRSQAQPADTLLAAGGGGCSGNRALGNNLFWEVCG